MKQIFPIGVIERHCHKRRGNRVRRNVVGVLAILSFASILSWLPMVVGTAVAQSQEGQGANPFTNSGEVASPRAPRRVSGYTISLSERVCRRLTVSHEPSADVAYKPGVDVRGEAVVPADLPGGFEWVAPDTIEFDLAFNPLGNTGLDADAFANTSARIGHVKYDILTGNLTLNGRPLADPILAIIESQCRAAGLLD